MKRRTWASSPVVTVALFVSLLVLAVLASTSRAVAQAQPAGPAGPVDARKIKLTYKFTAGETIRWQVDHRVDFETTVQGHTQKASTSSKSIKSWKVHQVSEAGGPTLTHSVESVDMWQELTGRARVSYNSLTDKEPAAGFEAVAASVGVPLSVLTLDPRGKLESREVKFKAAGQVSSDSDDDRQITMVLPEGAVGIGESWNLPYPIKVNTGTANKVVQARDYYILKSLDGDIATIEFETQILTPNVEPTVRAMLVQQGGRGLFEFDIAAGRVRQVTKEVNETVVGFRGNTSSLRYISRFTETLLSPEPRTAQSEAKAETK